MTRRSRSVLIDSTIGRIFTNISSVATASPTSMIAGAKLSSKSITQNSKATVAVANNIGNTGLFFAGGAVITQVIASVVKPCLGGSIKVRLKMGATYASAVTVGPEILLDTNVKKSTYSMSITVPQGESVFADVVQRGVMAPGAGLTLNFLHYAG